jgi:hypothetical protein
MSSYVGFSRGVVQERTVRIYSVDMRGLIPGRIIFAFDSEWRLTLGPTSLVYKVATEGNFRRSTAAEARNCLLIQAYCMNLALPFLLDVTLCLVVKHNLCFLF